MDIKSFIGDDSKQGVWLTHPEYPEAAFKVAYCGNDDYVNFIAMRYAKARRGRRDVPPEKDRAITIEALHKFILKDWKGLTKDGADFPFTTENAKFLITQSLEIRRFLLTEGEDLENFRTNHDEETGKEDTSAEADLKSGAGVEPPVG